MQIETAPTTACLLRLACYCPLGQYTDASTRQRAADIRKTLEAQLPADKLAPLGGFVTGDGGATLELDTATLGDLYGIVRSAQWPAQIAPGTPLEAIVLGLAAQVQEWAQQAQALDSLRALPEAQRKALVRTEAQQRKGKG